MKITVLVQRTYPEPPAPFYAADTKIRVTVEDDRMNPPTIGALQAITKLTTDIAKALK